MSSTPKVAPDELADLAEFIHQACGIVIDSSKAYLLESRLGPLLRQYNFPTYRDLYRKAKMDKSIAEELIDAMTTNETYFFREDKTFDLLKFKLIPEFLEKSPNLQIWSAACSFGQEAYSIAMNVYEIVPDPTDFQIQITGTDISNEAVAYASKGLYTAEEIRRGINPQRQNRFFDSVDGKFQVRDELRGLMHFRTMNLIEPFPIYKRFDVIFCRNVLIYFDNETKAAICSKFKEYLKPGGMLFVGASEMLLGAQIPFERQERDQVVYYTPKV